MSISLRQALRLAVGPANVDAAGHAVADWFDSIDRNATANRVREALRDQPDQPAPDAVPHDRPDTSLRSELMAKLATHREVLLNLCDRVDRLEMRADGLTPIERVERRWAKEAAGGDKLDRLIAQIKGADGPAAVARQPSYAKQWLQPPQSLFIDCYEFAERELQQNLPLKFVMSGAIRQAYTAGHADGSTAQCREPAAVGQPSDKELGRLWACAAHIDQEHGGVKFARAVLARWGHQPAPPGNKNTPASPVSTEMNRD